MRIVRMPITTSSSTSVKALSFRGAYRMMSLRPEWDEPDPQQPSRVQLVPDLLVVVVPHPVRQGPAGDLPFTENTVVRDGRPDQVFLEEPLHVAVAEQDVGPFLVDRAGQGRQLGQGGDVKIGEAVRR